MSRLLARFGRILLVGMILGAAVGSSLIPTTATHASTVALYVNGDGYATSWNNVGAPTDWQCVDETTPDESATYVWSEGPATEYLNLQDWPYGAAVINSVTVYVRARYSVYGGRQLWMGLRLNSTDSTASQVSTTTGYVTYSATISRPGGGSWSTSDITNLQLYFRNEDVNGFDQCLVTQAYIVVDYNLITAPTISTSSATSITYRSARLHGSVTDTGYENPTVTVYWGDNDGGTNPASWDYSSAPTSPAQPQGAVSFYMDILSLNPLTTYYFTAKATNSAGTSWGTTQSFTTPSGRPVMSVSAATSVEETTATLNGSIDSVEAGGVDIRGFVLDTSSHGDPGNVAPDSSGYSFYYAPSGSYDAGAYTYGIVGLSPGTTYYYRSFAHNLYGYEYSDAEQTFYTKCYPVTSFTVTAASTTSISLTWTKGTGSEKTMIRYLSTGYPANTSDGTQAYYDTGSSTTVSGLSTGVMYYFRAWAWDTNAGYSDDYVSGSATTDLASLSSVLLFQPNDLIHGEDYSTGTVTVTNGDATVVGAGGASWTDDLEGGIFVTTDAAYYVIDTVTDSTHLELTTVYGGASLSGQAYDIYPRLPDRSGTGSDGVIIFGANSDGVTATMGGLIAGSQAEPGVTEEDTIPSDSLGEAESSEWFTEPDVSSKLLTNPLRPFILLMSDNSSLTESQVWVFMGLVFVILVTVATGKFVHGHHIITGIAAGCAIGVCAATTVWPLWALVFIIPAILGGAVADRTPSL